MSRTPLFAAVKKALAAASLDQGIVWPRSSALTRRRLLLTAAAASAAALAPMTDWKAYAKKPERHKRPVPRSVAIIGGGVAGLTAAYRLQQAGATPVVFEASNRWGGRMFTQYDFYKGMFCELGGELVDTNHEELHALGKELGVEMQSLTADGGEDIYYFRDKFHIPTEMIDPAKKSGAFAPMAKQIAKDAAKLTDKNDDWTKYAVKLDQTSLADYLKQFRGKVDDWVIDLVEVAYIIEFGLELDVLSSLHMVDYIFTDMSKPFSLFGESDEAYRIKGGSSALIKALVAALENKIDMKQGHALTSLATKDKQILVGLSAPGGVATTETYDAVILALPFTKLRQVEGLDGLGLSPEKLKTIRELGMGSNSKIMVGTTSRVWRDKDIGLPAPSSGAFYTDLGFQTTWETSRAQPGEAGILTDYLGGKAAEVDAKTALDNFTSGMAKISPKIGASLDPNAVTSWFWYTYPFTLGSYASCKVGQYTTMLDEAAVPALHGRLQFAGEQTSGDFIGFMNGGVSSGNRAAADLTKIMALHKQK